MNAQPQVASPPAPPRPQWLPPELFPFASRFISIQGHRLHYVDEGRGAPLLMLHGNPTYSFLYRHLIAGLAAHCRCIALDYPGFGLSHAAAGYGYTPAEHARVVGEFIRALDLDRLTVLGHDWGGPIGLGAAVSMPERLAGLVLFNTFAWPAQGDAHFEGFSRLMGGPLGAFLIGRCNFFVNVILPLWTRTPLPPAVKRAYRGPFASVASRRAMQVLPGEILGSRAFLESTASRLAQLAHLPVLLIWGDADLAFQPRYCTRLETLFPNHTTLHLPRAKHYVPEDAPQESIAAIRRWLAARRSSAPGPDLP